MLYIGFSQYSHKIHSRIFCNKYKHCAPIQINGDNAIIYQFVRVNKIVQIQIHKKDLNILKHNGWKFIKYRGSTNNSKCKFCLTCVQFTKHMCNIKNIKIQTPDALLEYLTAK